MSPKQHSKKVVDRSIEKKSKSPFRCNNCGKTFVSESEKHAHERSHQSGEKPQKQ